MVKEMLFLVCHVLSISIENIEKINLF